MLTIIFKNQWARSKTAAKVLETTKIFLIHYIMVLVCKVKVEIISKVNNQVLIPIKELVLRMAKTAMNLNSNISLQLIFNRAKR